MSDPCHTVPARPPQFSPAPARPFPQRSMPRTSELAREIHPPPRPKADQHNNVVDKFGKLRTVSPQPPDAHCVSANHARPLSIACEAEIAFISRIAITAVAVDSALELSFPRQTPASFRSAKSRSRVLSNATRTLWRRESTIICLGLAQGMTHCKRQPCAILLCRKDFSVFPVINVVSPPWRL